MDRWNPVRKNRFDLDLLSYQLPDQFHQVGDHHVQVQMDGVHHLAAGEREHLPREVGGPLGGLLDLVEILQRLHVPLEVRPQELAESEDPGEDVIEVVCDPTGERPHRLHALCHQELLFELNPARDVVNHGKDAYEIPGFVLQVGPEPFTGDFLAAFRAVDADDARAHILVQDLSQQNGSGFMLLRRHDQVQDCFPACFLLRPPEDGFGSRVPFTDAMLRIPDNAGQWHETDLKLQAVKNIAQRLFRFRKLPLALCFLQRPSQRGNQPRELLLEHVVRRTALQRFDREIFPHRAGNEDEWDQRPLLLGDLQGGEAIKRRKRVIRQDNVDFLLFDRPEKRLLRVHLPDLVRDPSLGEFRLDELAVQGVVFEVQDPQRIMHGSLPLLHSSRTAPQLQARTDPGGGSLMTAQNSPRVRTASTNSWKSTGFTT